MAEQTQALGPVHPDCPTCACGKRAPVVPGGSIAWSEHEAAWVAYSRVHGTAQSADDIAERGGFSIGELADLLQRQPSTWRATPAERVPTDRVEVFQDARGEWRWHRQAANGRVISDSGEGYTDPEHAVKMASRLNAGVEIRLPDELKAPPLPPRDPTDPTFPPSPGPLTPDDDVPPVQPSPEPEQPVQPEEPPATPTPEPEQPAAPEAEQPPATSPTERPFDGPVVPYLGADKPEGGEGNDEGPPPAEGGPGAVHSDEDNGAAGASPLEPPPGG